MDAFVETVNQLLLDWGYVGMFISSFLAGSIVPFSSEIVMAAGVQVGLSAAWCVVWCTLGNTAGGMTCYWLGHLGRMDWIERYLKVKREKLDRMQRFLRGKGAVMGFFAFLPFVGEAIAIALGLMRSNVWITATAMFVGKLIRYWVLMEGILQAAKLINQ